MIDMIGVFCADKACFHVTSPAVFRADVHKYFTR